MDKKASTRTRKRGRPKKPDNPGRFREPNEGAIRQAENINLHEPDGIGRYCELDAEQNWIRDEQEIEQLRSRAVEFAVVQLITQGVLAKLELDVRVAGAWGRKRAERLLIVMQSLRCSESGEDVESA